jgi:hypothetical protein
MRYLRIFSWFLFTFGIVGFGATALGIDLGIGTGGAALGAMALQVLVSGLVLWGFKLHEAGKLHREVLVAGGWLLLVVFIVAAQILVIMGQNREQKTPEAQLQGRSEGVSATSPTLYCRQFSVPGSAALRTRAPLIDLINPAGAASVVPTSVQPGRAAT